MRRFEERASPLTVRYEPASVRGLLGGWAIAADDGSDATGNGSDATADTVISTGMRTSRKALERLAAS